jgi:hypothetical protein
MSILRRLGYTAQFISERCSIAYKIWIRLYIQLYEEEIYFNYPAKTFVSGINEHQGQCDV